MKLIINCAFLLVLLACDINANPLSKSHRSDEPHFVNKMVLREPNVYTLYWNYTDTDIIFKAVVQTPGWAGFGLSPNGGMYSSDVVLAWFGPDGTEHFVDAHVGPSGLHRPIVDVHQNWKKLEMKHENGFLHFTFTRKLKVCGQADSGEVNLEIQGTMPVIFAGGDEFEDDMKSFPKYHGTENRGSKVLPILGSLNEEITLNYDNIETADFTVDTTLPEGLVTEYYCQLFKVPDSWMNKKKHVIRYDTLTTPENLKYVHHWLMYECSGDLEQQYLNEHGWPQPESCLHAYGAWAQVQGYCKKISLAWAIGGDLEVYMPKEYGYPIGGPVNSFKYFFIQMHYENPNLDSNVHDKSGFRLFATEDYRPIEFGILTVGSDSNPLGINIPPKFKKLSIENVCKKTFMNNMYKEAGQITVFAELPHTHLAGIEMYTKVLRNNKEVEYLSNNKYYDSNFQYVNFMPNPVVLKQDDEIISTCRYNTEDRNGMTSGGLGTYDEMCLNFLWYYPRNVEYEQCLEITEQNEWSRLFNEMNERGDIDLVINSEQTIEEDAVNSLLNSEKFKADPGYFEGVFQDFYDNALKVGIYYITTGDNYEVYNHGEIDRIADNDEC